MVSNRSGAFSPASPEALCSFSLGGALQSQLRRKIEDDREIGLRRADNGTVDGFDHVKRQAARRALIGARRIAEAVADHPGAAFERGPDREFQMRFTRRVKQNGFPKRPEFLRFAGEKDFADGFGARRASRLAGLKDVNAEALQPLGENRRLGRLSRRLRRLRR